MGEVVVGIMLIDRILDSLGLAHKRELARTKDMFEARYQALVERHALELAELPKEIIVYRTRVPRGYESKHKKVKYARLFP